LVQDGPALHPAKAIIPTKTKHRINASTPAPILSLSQPSYIATLSGGAASFISKSNPRQPAHLMAKSDFGRYTPRPCCTAPIGRMRIILECGGRVNDLQGYFFEDIEIGQTASYAKTVTETDVVMFAAVSGDTNPLHLNQEYASETMFKGRIAHGMLSAGFVSNVFGTKLPGPGCIYVSQSLRFKAPVRIGDTVRARVEVTELIPDKKRAVFKTVCTVGNTVVIDGEAILMVPSRP
jgi:3-hydroxybutyryl-CoA dehydratase